MAAEIQFSRVEGLREERRVVLLVLAHGPSNLDFISAAIGLHRITVKGVKELVDSMIATGEVEYVAGSVSTIELKTAQRPKD